ncbi:hypothetical protein [Flexithrix dorotheae]|uniref:hypothetical protein n=1 Tax=Flexithrix dorotheae TaxID=70993 RepID=UPI000364F250|nr:hypothetical protein [Flexithrix dorotheae]
MGRIKEEWRLFVFVLVHLIQFQLKAQPDAQWATMPGGPNNDYGREVALTPMVIYMLLVHPGMIHYWILEMGSFWIKEAYI